MVDGTQTCTGENGPMADLTIIIFREQCPAGPFGLSVFCKGFQCIFADKVLAPEFGIKLQMWVFNGNAGGEHIRHKWVQYIRTKVRR